MSAKLENAKCLYLEGIRDGNAREAVTKYTGARYTQHSTGVADGVEGFVSFFEPFIANNPVRDIQVVRGLVDGQYVFVHVYQNLNNGAAQWVTMDLFDTDENDKIIEHWDVIQAFEENTVSGHSMVDGPTEVEDLDKTAENKALVSNFLETVLVGGHYDKVADFISAEQYTQHGTTLADGLQAVQDFLTGLADRGDTLEYIKIHRVIGQGNFVVAYSHVKFEGDEFAVFDLFRVQDGKIVEHWDTMEKILPADQWGNSGKF